MMRCSAVLAAFLTIAAASPPIATSGGGLEVFSTGVFVSVEALPSRQRGRPGSENRNECAGPWPAGLAPTQLIPVLR